MTTVFRRSSWVSCRARPSRCEWPARKTARSGCLVGRVLAVAPGDNDVCHEESPATAHVLARCRYDDGAAAARIDGAGVYGARADARQSADPLRRGLRAERRDDEALDA